MLGKLKKVDLREGWRHEALDFTKWLAQEENLNLLSQEIGFDIKLIQTEAKVGSFNVDILAEEENTNNKIIIENQLEISDHDHLGKIITYASGYDAKTIIWVVKDVRDEHKSAIEWLNENTTDEVGFYLFRIELWQIGDSPLAPKFEIISKPNNWVRAVKETVGKRELGELNIKQLEYWEAFKDYVKQNNTTLKLQKSLPQHWTNISIGSSEYHLALSVKMKEGSVVCELYIHDNKDIFKSLEKKKNEIENELGMKLEWLLLPSRVLIEKPSSFDTEQDKESSFEWLQNTAENFVKVLPKYLNQIEY